jgi:hypothetical protein
METRQWSHVIRVTAIAAAQYGQRFEIFGEGSNGITSFPNQRTGRLLKSKDNSPKP